MSRSDAQIAAELEEFSHRIDAMPFSPDATEQKLTMRHGMRAPWKSLDAHDDQNAKGSSAGITPTPTAEEEADLDDTPGPQLGRAFDFGYAGMANAATRTNKKSKP